MEGLRDVEYLPEPSDRRIVSAADPTVVGFQDEWRSEIMGWAPLPVEPVRECAVAESPSQVWWCSPCWCR